MRIPFINYTYFAAICLFSLVGCESMVNDLGPDKLPKQQSKLVVESYISPQSKTIEALVTESQPLFGVATYEIKAIKNANVTLSGPSGEVVLPYNDSLARYIVSASKFKIEAGQTYKLTVSDPDRTVTASCTVPARSVPLKKYTLSMIEGEPERWDTTARRTSVKARFYWDDIANEKNYYLVRGYARIEQNNLSYSPGGTNIQIVRGDYTNPFLLNGMMDNSADGLTLNSEFLEFSFRNYIGQYTLLDGKVYKYNSDTKLKGIYVEILTIDENYHQFHRTSSQGSGDNPFVEPTLVYNNIQGGLGCFGAFNASSTIIVP